MKLMITKIIQYLSLIVTTLALSQCSSYEQFRYITEEFEIPTKVIKADYNQTWLAVLEVMKNLDLQLKDQESGIIKTRWIDNTIELNFADSFGGKDSVKSAKYKLIVNVIKGYRGRREVSKVTVFKRQMIEQDFLQGWKPVPTDGIYEKAILYRIDREIEIRNRIKKIEEQKAKELEADF